MPKQNNIRVFLRIKPDPRPYKQMEIDPDNNKVSFHIERRTEQDYVSNMKEDYNFKFDGLLSMQAKQEEVFERVGRECIENIFEGFNSTVFAYGQTGSGKTFTITGGAERYVDRGLIPRSIGFIFKEIGKRTDSRFKVSVSYIEIYNDAGYDLLDENHNTKNLMDLPKVIPREDANEQITLSNLSVHRAENEEDALNLLFIGDTNRVISVTPKNDQSTRSHCIFILQLEGQKIGSDVKTVSRLNLVDLSGSERVGKTGVTGLLLKEARAINLSLHFLEQVIVCLNKRAKGEQIHIPYRNSLITLILRDSLGGNCKTTMVATISVEEEDIAESVSTCRFAQRVSLVSNSAVKNEELDSGLIIQRLKQEITELKAEIKMLKGTGGYKEMLDQEDIEECRKITKAFIENPDPSQKLVLSDMLMINECFFQLKRLCNENKVSRLPQISSGKEEQSSVSNEEVQRLKMLIQQRDTEIAILLNVLNKSKENKALTASQELQIKNATPMKVDLLQKYHQGKEVKFSNQEEEIEEKKQAKLKQLQPSISEKAQQQALEIQKQQMQASMRYKNIEISQEDLADRTRSFEIFRRSYRKFEAMEENKQLLKSKYDEAKILGANVNNARNQVANIKNEIEQLRREQALQGLVDENNIPIEHPKEPNLRQRLDSYKQQYVQDFEKLKEIKKEIERIQQMLEKSRDRMNHDFQQ